MALDLSALEERPLNLSGSLYNQNPLKEGEEIAQKIQVDLLQPGKYQPRKNFDDDSLKELADSIKAQGVLQPIIVRPIDNDRFEIIAGERRWRASKIAGKKDIPAIVREIDDKHALAIGLVENIQRTDLDPMEEALSLQQLKDEFNLKNKEVAEAVGKTPSEISRLLGLLKLPDCLKELYERGVKSSNVLEELARAYKDNPEATEAFVFDKDSITRKEARDFKDREKIEAKEREKIPLAGFSEEGESENNIGSEGENETEDNRDLNDGSENEQGEGENDLTKPAKKKETITDPNKIKKPLIIVDFDDRACSIQLNKKPSSPGLIWIKYEDGSGEDEIDAGRCKINLLTEA